MVLFYVNYCVVFNNFGCILNIFWLFLLVEIFYVELKNCGDGIVSLMFKFSL